MKNNTDNNTDNKDKNILDISYFDIVNVLNEYVKRIAKEYWKDDGCPPEFLVSLYYGNKDDQIIMITINHNDCLFTEKLFPKKETSIYGYGSVFDQMTNMYDRTM